jgi:membrane-bound lytic murein transglycosylase A
MFDARQGGAMCAVVVAALLTAACAPPDAVRAEPAVSVAPLLSEAYAHRADGLETALARSRAWLDGPAAAARYPFTLDDGRVLSRAEARAALDAVSAALAAGDETAFRRVIESSLEARESAGPAHFTAYYAPEYAARRRPGGRFRHPLHAAPPALAPDNPRRAVWHTRREIEDGSLLAGREIAWLPDALSAYLVQVNGSARLRLADGSFMHVGHCATNERPYTSLGRLLIEAGRVPAAEMSMAAIRAEFRRDPEGVEALMRRNDRYVFFEVLPGARWPRSAFGIALTPGASAATDPALVPPGAVLLVETTLPDGAPYVRLVVSQDTGGAIRGPGRVDLYLGAGEEVGAVAGRMNAGGRVLMLRPRPGAP